VTLWPAHTGEEAALHVKARTPPSNPIFDCPYLVPDCLENFPVCVDGGTLFVNAATECTVGVEHVVAGQESVRSLVRRRGGAP
jgi:hypothetical protein